MALQWKAAKHVSASVRTEGGILARLSADFRTYIYVCMSCAKVLHKHNYEEGEICLKSPQVWLESHEGGLPTDLQSLKADIGGGICKLARPDAGKACPLEAILSSNRFFVSGELLILWL